MGLFSNVLFTDPHALRRIRKGTNLRALCRVRRRRPDRRISRVYGIVIRGHQVSGCRLGWIYGIRIWEMDGSRAISRQWKNKANDGKEKKFSHDVYVEEIRVEFFQE